MGPPPVSKMGVSPQNAADARVRTDPTDALARFGVPFLLVTTVLTGAACVLVGARKWQIGIPGEWTWSYYERPVTLLDVFVPLIPGALLVAVTGIALARRISRGFEETAAVVIILFLAWGVTRTLSTTGPWGAEGHAYVTATGWIGGYYGEAVRESNRGSLRRYLQAYGDTISRLKVDDRIRGHIADHPPGPVVFHWLVNRTLERHPRLAGWFIPGENSGHAASTDLLRATCEEFINLQDDLAYVSDPPNPNRRLTRLDPPVPLSRGAFAGIWASATLLQAAFWLSLVPLYLLGRETHSAEAGLVAVSLSALIPSLHLFTPYVDQVFPLFATWGYYAWHRAMTGKSVWWAALAAIVVFAGLLWSLSLLLAVGILGLATLLKILAEWREMRTAFRASAWAIIVLAATGTFMAVSLLPLILFRYHTWEVWKVCLTQHARFSALFHRSYLPWLWFNPVEFLLFAGVPTAVALVATAYADLRCPRPSSRWPVASLITWSLVGVLLVADISGKNLGEVARLWMFLMPFAALAAAPVVVRLDGKRGWVAAGVAMLTLAQTITFRLRLDVFGLDVYFR